MSRKNVSCRRKETSRRKTLQPSSLERTVSRIALATQCCPLIWTTDAFFNQSITAADILGLIDDQISTLMHHGQFHDSFRVESAR